MQALKFLLVAMEHHPHDKTRQLSRLDSTCPKTSTMRENLAQPWDCRHCTKRPQDCVARPLLLSCLSLSDECKQRPHVRDDYPHQLSPTTPTSCHSPPARASEILSSDEGVGREAVVGRSVRAAKRNAAQTLTAEILEVIVAASCAFTMSSDLI